MVAQVKSNFLINLDSNKLPKHVAIIMDGNGRWATNKGLPRISGHRQGALVLKEILRCCKNWQIQVLTVYAFSTENWVRNATEVNFLMKLFEGLLETELNAMKQEGVCINILGDCSFLPSSLQKIIQHARQETVNNQTVYLNLAINYGSRQEIIQACRNLATQVQLGKIQPSDIEENLFQQFLYTANLPDPDLLIRTSGEMRISNFLLWQIAYSELYITQTMWPDFTPEEFHQALLVYQTRKRRFGKV